MNKRYCYAAVIHLSLLLAGVQQARATIYLTSAGWSVPVGNWDGVTATLTQDVTETIQIDVSGTTLQNVVLDGAGYTVSGVSGAAAVYVKNKEHVTIENLLVTGCTWGIWLHRTGFVGDSYHTVKYNTISACEKAIMLSFSHNNTVTGNTCSACGEGVSLGDSDNNTVTGNTVTGAGYEYASAGIWLGGGATGNNIDNNVLGDLNSISGNAKGIYAQNCGSNTLTSNTISNNDSGIRLFQCLDFSVTTNNVSDNGLGIDLYNATNSEIYKNNFIDNDVQANIQYGSGNVFDLGGTGNYWSDYAGVDDGTGGRLAGDGIGDTDIPHLGLDNYPFIVGNGWSNDPPIADAGPDQTVEANSDSANVSLDGSGSSDDPIQPLTYIWQWNGGSESGVNPTVTLPVGTTQVTLTVSDGVLSDTDTVEITVQNTEQTPQEVVQDIIDYIVEDMYVPPEAEKEVGKAVKELNKAIKEFNKGKPDKAIKKIEKAIKQLEKAGKKGADTEGVIDALLDLIDEL